MTKFSDWYIMYWRSYECFVEFFVIFLSGKGDPFANELVSTKVYKDYEWNGIVKEINDNNNNNNNTWYE